MRKPEPNGNVAPMATKALPARKGPETPEQTSERRWLRRFATRALSIDPPLKTVALGKDGWVPGTKVLAAARGDPSAPGKLTMETLIAVITTSGKRLEMKHEEKTGLLVRATSRQTFETPKEQELIRKDTRKLAAEVKRDTQKKMKKKHATNQARREVIAARQQVAAVDREENRQKRLKAAHQRALRDPANLRSIADPNDLKRKAKIAPPLKRVGRGTTIADARQAVQDRKR